MARTKYSGFSPVVDLDRDPPQPQRSIADCNMHLWRDKLPELHMGIHTIEVVSIDRNGLKFIDLITIEVREERPPRYWKYEIWK